ncbi:amidase [Auricularia subglabra TFB-10046 SS5]|nr:amidase [Auricularia subglabra TFB-10046 SS5]
MWPFKHPAWKLNALAKQDQRAKAVDEGLQAAGPAFASDEAYLRATASEIVRRIQLGQWTAGAVVRAYVRRAALVQSRLNCVTEVRFGEAIAEADALDAEFASTKTLRGRLHGVPLTVKDQIKVAGLATSCGYGSWAHDIAEEDGGLVKLLRTEGAILIAKTNVPQTIFTIECSNPLWGVTRNPWDEKRTTGGSSGGEAALLAMDGSALGIGTDVAGSIRIPASFCGFYSFKPSAFRVTHDGERHTCPGFEGLNIVAGPMARSVEDLDLWARVVLGRSDAPWETINPVLYREVSVPRRLRFGYYTQDDYIRTSPVCARAVLETVSALAAAGYEVIEFKPPRVGEALNTFVGLASADGYSTIQAPIGSEPIEAGLFITVLGTRLPGIVRSLVAWLAKVLTGDTHFASLLSQTRAKSVAEYFMLTAARDEYRRMWHKEVWEQGGFDGIISPVVAVPAVKHGQSAMVASVTAATLVYNLLDYPVGHVPVTRVDAEKDSLSAEWLAAPCSSYIVERELYLKSSPIYDAHEMHGMPVGVQVVAKRLEDEKVLAMMRVIDDALGKRDFGPGTWQP